MAGHSNFFHQQDIINNDQHQPSTSQSTPISKRLRNKNRLNRQSLRHIPWLSMHPRSHYLVSQLTGKTKRHLIWMRMEVTCLLFSPQWGSVLTKLTKNINSKKMSISLLCRIKQASTTMHLKVLYKVKVWKTLINSSPTIYSLKQTLWPISNSLKTQISWLRTIILKSLKENR